MSELKTKIDAAYETFNAEYAKFTEKGNASAGTRADGNGKTGKGNPPGNSGEEKF